MTFTSSLDSPAAEHLSRPVALERDERPSWRESAACRNMEPDLFFPVGSAGHGAVQTRQAKSVCARCPVQRPCLTYAVTTGQDYGVWGGRNEEERRLLRREWRAARIAAGLDQPRPMPGERPRLTGSWTVSGAGEDSYSRWRQR